MPFNTLEKICQTLRCQPGGVLELGRATRELRSVDEVCYI